MLDPVCETGGLILEGGAMPHAYAAQFRAMVVEQVRSGRRVAEVAAAVEVPEATVFRWVRQDRIDRGELSGTTTAESAQLRAAKRRIGELEAELATVASVSMEWSTRSARHSLVCSSTTWRILMVRPRR
jgi:transposase